MGRFIKAGVGPKRTVIYTDEALMTYVDTSIPGARVATDLWSTTHSVELKFIQPGKPGHTSWFEDLEDARRRIEEWRIEYSTVRPNTPLGKETPAESAKRHMILLLTAASKHEVTTTSI